MLQRIHDSLFRLSEKINKARPYKSPIEQIPDALLHKLRINTRISDYYRFQFYKGDKSWEEKSRYVSFEGSMYWPYEKNSLEYQLFFTNKYLQKSVFQGLHLPTPELVATIGDNFQIRTREQLDSLLKSITYDIVLKPVNGTYGCNVLVLSRCGDHVQCRGNVYSTAEIWEHINSQLHIGYLVEKKASNCSCISSIFPGCLNTFRVVTINFQEEGWYPLVCYLKIGQGQSQVDNAMAGGIVMIFDASGTAIRTFDCGQHKFISRHPDTGAELLGFHFDHYREIIDFALGASNKFGFLGTIGWDIASTEEGPLIIEANGAWGAEGIQQATGKGLITDELATKLKRHTLFGTWDKSKMYPNFHKNRLLLQVFRKLFNPKVS